jgi:FkbM family methyltransferase
MKLDVALPHLYTKAGYEFIWDYLHQHPRSQNTGEFDLERLSFLGFCMSNLAHSHAQLYQDLYVLFKLGSKRNGFFVEFGAASGMHLSNTYLLEKTVGWTGVLAEPFPIWHSQLAQHRSVPIDKRCVWNKTGEKLEFLGTDHAPEFATLMSFKDSDKHSEWRSQSKNVFVVETVTLNDLLEQHGAPDQIDYLSVDTEGSEFEILSLFNFKKYQPKIITVEHNFNTLIREKLFDLLTFNGYKRQFEEFSKFDDWYYFSDK